MTPIAAADVAAVAFWVVVDEPPPPPPPFELLLLPPPPQALKATAARLRPNSFMSFIMLPKVTELGKHQSMVRHHYQLFDGHST